MAFADGGSRGNPGNAACATILYNENGDELMRRAKRVGKATNNVAEYEGVILALGLCHELGGTKVRLKLDSELIVKQINGAYKVKNAGLKPLFVRVMRQIEGFDSFSVEHVPRRDNADTDSLVNAALDGREDDVL